MSGQQHAVEHPKVARRSLPIIAAIVIVLSPLETLVMKIAYQFVKAMAATAWWRLNSVTKVLVTSLGCDTLAPGDSSD
jgi:hypothetical protein